MLAEHRPERRHYAPMDAQALVRYNLFDKLGFYGVDRAPCAGRAFFFEDHAGHSRSRTPQCGSQAKASSPMCAFDLRGYARASAISPRGCGGVILTLAIEYPFWDERFPEASVRFGAPIEIESAQNLRAAQWVERIEASLAAAQDALVADALSRSTRAFETLLMGKVAIGGIYDRWRRVWAWFRGERFRAEHSGKGVTVILAVLAWGAPVLAAIPARLFRANLRAINHRPRLPRVNGSRVYPF